MNRRRVLSLTAVFPLLAVGTATGIAADNPPLATNVSDSKDLFTATTQATASSWRASVSEMNLLPTL
jgi:hypothetical protein